ncbi:hypothetical protein [Mycobacterium kiyosense]|uniref:hypothetical protein n=2 Tax=Mycobacteriaceae TaxID=1762 RepID=UPI00222E45DD|nr:hypothetical protein [Mycobacterium kiyosense]
MLTDAESQQVAELLEARKELDERIAFTRGEIARSGDDNPLVQRLRAATGNTTALANAEWARRAAPAIVGSGGENRAVSVGSLDVRR